MQSIHNDLNSWFPTLLAMPNASDRFLATAVNTTKNISVQINENANFPSVISKNLHIYNFNKNVILYSQYVGSTLGALMCRQIRKQRQHHISLWVFIAKMAEITALRAKVACATGGSHVV